MSGGSSRLRAKLREYRVVLYAVGAIVLVFALLTAYSGMWPPLVVVESSSMQHSDDTSYIGVIDTGDMVIVKTTDSDVVTYIEGSFTGYSTYGEYGDVVIYRPYGSDEYTPIIHRAMCWMVVNESGSSYDIPELATLPSGSWAYFEEGVEIGERWWDLTGIVRVYGVGYADVTMVIDISTMIYDMVHNMVEPYDGLVTMGDHNWMVQDGERIGMVDQNFIMKRPVAEDWVKGVSRGEVPWFGLVKLYLTGSAPDNVPSNSVYSLVTCIVLIIGVPLCVDYADHRLKRKGSSLKEMLFGRFRR